MKNFFKKIIDFLKDVFKVIDENEAELETFDEESIIEQVDTKQVENDLKSASKEEYKMLSNKERQTYLKKIGLYTKSIDGIRGDGQKKAEKQFNIIFLNKNTTTYSEDTDKILREFYASYSKTVYMQDTDWKYFKNFDLKQYKCKCDGKYCDGVPHKVYKRLVMKDQYVRNRLGKPIYITSGLRCEKHNKNEGGVSNSKHLYGRASDEYEKNTSATENKKIVNELPFINYSYNVTSKVVHGDVKK